MDIKFVILQSKLQNIIMYNRNKVQNMKQGAYLQYFKFFSTSATETIRKLQTNFQDQLTDNIFFDSQLMFKRIKILLTSYQVLILEINDSCQFVQIPQFGVCIVKIFFQLMSIIRFLAKGQTKKAPQERFQREKRPDQRYTMINHNSEPYSDIPHIRQGQNFRMREHADHIFKELNQQVGSLQKQHKNNIKQSDDTLENIYKGRQKLQEIQSSQSEAVLAEAVSLLFKRGEHINNFLNLLQDAQSLKNEPPPQTYAKLRQKIQEEIMARIQQAKSKLSQLFNAHIQEHQHKKKASMVSKSIQVEIQEPQKQDVDKKRKTDHRKTHADQIKKLKQQMHNLDQQNQALKAYISSKNQEFQTVKNKIITQKSTLQTRISAFQNRSSTLKIKASTTQNKKSMTNLDARESIQNVSEAKSHVSIEPDGQDNVNEIEKTSMKRSKMVKIPKIIKSRVKFVPQQQHQRLEICLNVYSLFFSSSHQLQLQQVLYQQPDALLTTRLNNQASPSKQIKINLITVGEQSAPFEKEMLLLKQKSKRDTEGDNQCELLKISNPLANLRSLRQSFPSQKDMSLRKSKKPNLTQLPSKEFPANQVRLSHQKQKSIHKSKKESFFCSLQENEMKKFSQFSRVSSKKYEDSKEVLKNIDKNSFGPLKDVKKCSYFAMSDNHVQIYTDSNPPIEGQPQQKGAQNFHFSPSKNPLCFAQKDLIQIFISQDNAKSYQFLNLSLAAKQKKYLSAMGGKIVIKENKNLKHTAKNDSLGFQFSSQCQTLEFLIENVFKAVSIMKKDKKNYQKVRSFLRYPYSSIVLAESSAWLSLQSEQNNIDYLQIRKLVTRIAKLHTDCGQALCKHWRYFLKKLDIQVQ